MGYDLPIAQRYVNYLKDIVTEGDFGTSYFSGRPVFDEIWPRFLVTIRMSLLILVISVCVGVPVGIYSAVKQYSLWDTVPTMMAFFLAAVPSFVIGMVLLYFFALKINIFPVLRPGWPEELYSSGECGRHFRSGCISQVYKIVHA